MQYNIIGPKNKKLFCLLASTGLIFPATQEQATKANFRKKANCPCNRNDLGEDRQDIGRFENDVGGAISAIELIASVLRVQHRAPALHRQWLPVPFLVDGTWTHCTDLLQNKKKKKKIALNFLPLSSNQ